MNERLLDICIKAGINTWPFNEVGFISLDESELERFAELIVRECISIVDEQKECLHEEQKYWHDRDYGYEMAVNDASNGIKQFFGVEE
jgi:hypothetical protein